VAVGIATGILFPGIWPFAMLAPTAPGISAAQSSPAKSAGKIAEEWGSGLDHDQKLTITSAPKKAPGDPTIIHLGSAGGDDTSATAFVVFITKIKFENVWKHFAEKVGYDGPKESLASGVQMNPENLRGGMQFGKGKDELMEFDFAGIGSAKPGVDPAGGRESHFGYFTEGYVVHVVIEEIAQDRWESYKGKVKVRVFAALR